MIDAADGISDGVVVGSAAAGAGGGVCVCVCVVHDCGACVVCVHA